MGYPPPETVSIVICVYTVARWELIEGSIASARRQVPAPAELIVVVDHNAKLDARLRAAESARAESIGSLEEKRAPRLPPLRIISNEGIPGLSDARNAGVTAACGDVIAFLDDDAEARPGWLATLLAGYGPDVIAVGGAAEPRWQGPDGWGAERPRWFPREFDWVVGCTYAGSPTSKLAVRNLLGANMSFRRAALLAAGPFDSRLGRVGTRPVGAEETELSIRARRALPGTTIVLDPAAVVDHHVGTARQSLRYFLARCYAEGGSKAALASLAGATEALATERSYVLRTLPAGLVRGIRDAAAGDLDGVRRALAIAIGLGATGFGYVVGRLRVVTRRDGGVRGGDSEVGWTPSP